MKKTLTTMMLAIGMIGIPAAATHAQADSNLSEGCALLNQPEFDVEPEAVTYTYVRSGRGGPYTVVYYHHQAISDGIRDVEFFPGETVRVVFESEEFHEWNHGYFNFLLSTGSQSINSWNYYYDYYGNSGNYGSEFGSITLELTMRGDEHSVLWYFDDEEESVPVAAYVSCEGAPGVDTDRDGVIDDVDTDDDNDGVLDADDVFPLDASEWADFDGDGIGDNADADDDNDGVLDTDDAFPFDASEWADFDGDGIGDNADADDDNDGVLDTDDAFPFDASEWADFDGDGIGDNADTATDTTATSAGVIADLIELNETFGNKHVTKAINELTDALTLGSVGVDTDRKVAKKVFHAYKKAVHELESAIKDADKADDGASTAVLRSSIDTLVEGSRRLAGEADGDGVATKYLDKAEASLAKDDPSKAVDYFGKGWSKATKN